MQAAMPRFCMTARISRPEEVLVSSSHVPNDDQARKADDKHPVVPKEHVVHREMALRPGGRIDLHIIGPEHHSEALLHDQ